MTHKKPLHTPHRSSKKEKDIWQEYPRAISDDLQKIAAEKGYRIDRGIRDHQHVVLECLICGGHTAQRIATLRTAQPACAACQLGAAVDTSTSAIALSAAVDVSTASAIFRSISSIGGTSCTTGGVAHAASAVKPVRAELESSNF